MSVKTTHNIIRSVAIQIILNEIEDASDQILASVVEELDGNPFRNYCIVTEKHIIDNPDEPSVKTVSEF